MASSGILQRELGIGGAVMLGLGSIVGTGVFVSLGIGAGVAGAGVVIAIVVGALVATCNGMSSAQLAASHPVSGGTYEYGYHYMSPRFGFVAGWMFLCAKSASAATAALGLSGYLLNLLAADQTSLMVPIAFAGVVVLTAVTLFGMQRTNRVNTVIVSITLLTLIFFVATGLPVGLASASVNLGSIFEVDDWPTLLQASALMFVAYTGYGRIATMGEEVREARWTIPRAIIGTLVVSMVLYVSVGFVAVAAVGADAFYLATTQEAAPLEVVARSFNISDAPWILAVGAVTAMAGVLLNLILGLSRVLLAMGRRGDMPSVVARLNADQTTPYVSVIVIGILIAGLTLLGSVKTTWSFSAFTVLIYYAITNYCALRISDEQRLYPKWISVLGLLACLGLAFFVEQNIWLAGCGLIVGGLCWQALAGVLGRERE